MLVTVPALGRRRTALLVRTAACVFFVTALWMKLHVPAHSRGAGEDGSSEDSPDPSPPPASNKVASSAPREADAGAGRSSNASRDLSIAGIRRSIEMHNELQIVLHEDLFGPVHNDTIVIVVQVHRRIAYLRHLITSLAQARDIDSVLLVFSHDFYDEEINELVQSVDFCKVMQIFYPHSIQTHPHEFPGESPADCPRNIKREQAKKLQCINALHPDSYGHYREAKFTQIKHHWWWKANRVFNQLRITRNFEGLVLFLEEDHYVVEDFIHVLRLLKTKGLSNCVRCNILSLGSYQKRFNYQAESNKAEVMVKWTGNRHNMGMALNRATWSSVLACAHVFCSYDDYNWDWSLQFSAQECLQADLLAVVMKQPRVFHLGQCGLHHNKKDCEPTAALSAVQRLLQSVREHLYPTELSLLLSGTSRKKLVKSNGGWGDVRDHQLCLNISLTVR